MPGGYQMDPQDLIEREVQRRKAGSLFEGLREMEMLESGLEGRRGMELLREQFEERSPRDYRPARPGFGDLSPEFVDFSNVRRGGSGSPTLDQLNYPVPQGNPFANEPQEYQDLLKRLKVIP
jgi:hypothetical protein